MCTYIFLNDFCISISIDLNWKHPKFLRQNKTKARTPQFYANITLLFSFLFFFYLVGVMICSIYCAMELCVHARQNRPTKGYILYFLTSQDLVMVPIRSLHINLQAPFFFFFHSLRSPRLCCAVVLCPLLLWLLTLFMYWVFIALLRVEFHGVFIVACGASATQALSMLSRKNQLF